MKCVYIKNCYNKIRNTEQIYNKNKDLESSGPFSSFVVGLMQMQS